MAEARPHGNARRFCLVFLALTMLWPFAIVFLVRSSVYEKLSTDLSDLVSDFYLNFRNQRFDVVVVGDSSGVYGVDPSVIRAATGLSALNLCQGITTLASYGTAALDYYLAYNSKPVLLALYLAPPSASIDSDTQSVDWLRDRIRHAPLRALPGLFGAQPVRFLQTLLALSLVTSRGIMRSVAAGEFQGDVSRSNHLARLGYIPNSAAMVLPDGCEVATGARQNWKRHEFIDQFRKKYSSLGIPIVVVSAPIADCDRSLADYQRDLGGVFDEKPYSISHLLIADDGFPLHPMPPATEGISRRFAARIQATLRVAEGSGR